MHIIGKDGAVVSVSLGPLRVLPVSSGAVPEGPSEPCSGTGGIGGKGRRLADQIEVYIAMKIGVDKSSARDLVHVSGQ